MRRIGATNWPGTFAPRESRWGALAPAAVAALALALAGCGSSSSKTSHPIRNITPSAVTVAKGAKRFSASGMAIHFRFPVRFVPVPLAASKRVAGAAHSNAAHAAVGIGRYDLLIISRFPGLRYAVTAANVRSVKPQFDALMSNVFGEPVTGTVGTAGGYPAIFFPRVPVHGLPVAATTRAANVFVGTDEYELQCQATSAGLAAIEAACNEMFRTLQVGGQT